MFTILLTQLSKTFGPAVATKVLNRLRSSRDGESKLKKVLDSAEHGVSVLSALREQFGPEFQSALNEYLKPDVNGWSYEAGTQQYVKSCADEYSCKIDALRDELNINLDRLASYAAENKKLVVTSHFRGLFSVWKKRYSELIGTSLDAQSTFSSMDELLDGKKKSFKDAYKAMSKTTLGMGGGILIIKGIFLAAGIGLGLWGSFMYWLQGIAFGPVAALTIPGTFMIYLSLKAFSPENAMTACIVMAYKLLERHQTATSE